MRHLIRRFLKIQEDADPGYHVVGAPGKFLSWVKVHDLKSNQDKFDKTHEYVTSQGFQKVGTKKLYRQYNGVRKPNGFRHEYKHPDGRQARIFQDLDDPAGAVGHAPSTGDTYFMISDEKGAW